MKQLFKIALLTAVPSSVFAEDQQSAGLPQMDISTFPSQIFWLIVTFSILYVFMWKFVIPKLRITIEERRDKISNDINEAEKLKSEAEEILNKYKSKMTSSNQDAVKIIAEAKKQSDEYTEKVKRDNKSKVSAMIEESNIKIAEQEEKSKSEIEKATLETIKSISEKFIDKLPSDSDIIKKLN
jgi:F-type H+-transporting ATPase subunit b